MTIHYHGTPINPKAVLTQMAGAHFCVPHSDTRQVAIAHDIGQSVMLDNGAFSAWRRGYEVDWPAYYEWTDQWLDCPTTWAVIPDVIVGDAAMQDDLISQWPHGYRGAPVWHMHEPIERLLSLLDGWPRVCIGSSAEYADLLTPLWERRMDSAWREIFARHRRTPNIHMLRGLQLVRYRWPFASVDSTDIARNHNRAGNTVAKMRERWDTVQCPRSFTCRGEQMELVA